MKILSTVLVFTVLFPLAAADDLAVGILVNGGFHSDFDHCNDSDHEILGGAFNEAMEEFNSAAMERRGLTPRRELYNCNFYCQGFPPGYCYMAYPKCTNHRAQRARELTIPELALEKLEANMAKAGLRKIQDNFKGPQTHLMKECKKAKVAIKERLASLHVSDKCKNLLHFKFDMTCLRVPAE